jgi:hypothetical protein
MRLEKWLEQQNIQPQVFARKIGIHRGLIHKYIHEDLIPQKKIIRKIYIKTLGAVSANDFFRFTDIIFAQNSDKLPS